MFAPAGLTIFTSNRLEVLAKWLADIVQTPLRSPFAPETIIVQSRGMERWISMQIAEHNGICANCRFPFPNAFLQDLFRNILPDQPQASLFDPDILAFRIMRLLPDLVDLPAFDPLKKYLSADDQGLKRFQLSQKIADTFDQYLVFRPEMVKAWESGKKLHWQAHFWRMLVSESETTHRARLREALLQALKKTTGHAEKLPERVSIFGISHLPKFHLAIFEALSRLIPVNLFLMNPCREFWADIVSAREKKRIRAIRETSDITDDSFHYDEGNRLLASMGALGRDFFSLVAGIDGQWIEQYTEPDGTSLLSSIQRDVLNLKEGSPVLPPRSGSPGTDIQIELHSCHSPMREVEVLYDNLLAMLEHPPGVSPKDIVVMTPDIDAYAPYIQAVFGAQTDESLRIPFSIADRTIRRKSRLTDAFLTFLDLKGFRFEASRMTGLLEFETIRKRFGIAESNLEPIERWVRETGIRWGIDEADRIDQGVPGFKENTWRFGIHRLLLGYAMSGGTRHRMFSDILPYDPIEGGDGKVLGRFIAFLEAVFRWIPRFGETACLKGWGESLQALLAEMFSPEDEAERDVHTLRSVLEDLKQIQYAAGYHAPVSFEMVRAFLRRRLETETVSSGFITGGVTFCAMLPMRSIPFAVVCLMGMNSETFPRQNRPLGFDLMAKYPKPGDRSIRNDDRYLFLEAVLSARRKLYISYVGQSIQDNSRIPPSVLVSELLDYIREGLAYTEKTLLVEHPLQAFSPAYFQGDGPLFSYSEVNRAAASGLIGPKRKPAFIPENLSDPPAAWRQVHENQLGRFYSHPARFLLQQRLGLFLEDKTSAAADRENFHLDPLQLHQIAQEVLEGKRTGIGTDRLERIHRAAGMLPHGTVGEVAYREICRDVDGFLKGMEWILDSSSATLPVCVNLAEFSLIGNLEPVYPCGLVRIRYATTKAKDLIHAWILHLMLCAGRPEVNAAPQKTFLICRDAAWCFSPLSDSRDILSQLLQFYWQGVHRPLRFFPESSLAFCKAVCIQNRSVEEALGSARKKWTGGGYDGGWAEGRDPYLRKCFGDEDPLDEDFQRIAVTVWEPVLNQCTPVDIRKEAHVA